MAAVSGLPSIITRPNACPSHSDGEHCGVDSFFGQTAATPCLVAGTDLDEMSFLEFLITAFVCGKEMAGLFQTRDRGFLISLSTGLFHPFKPAISGCSSKELSKGETGFLEKAFDAFDLRTPDFIG